MQRMTWLWVLVLSGCCLIAERSIASEVEWKWLVQYSYRQPNNDPKDMPMYDENGVVVITLKDEDPLHIVVQMYDDGRVDYIRHSPFADGGAAWWRSLKKTPEEVEEVKTQIATILAELSDDEQQPTKGSRQWQAGIVIRHSEELIEAWEDDKYGDPYQQILKVFKNWYDLSDDTHKTIQEVFKQFNNEADKIPWKWN